MLSVQFFVVILIRFIRRLTWLESQPLVNIVPDRSSACPTYFIYPSQTVSSTIFYRRMAIGSLIYGMDPFSEFLYIFAIHVDQPLQRRGFGLASLWALHNQYQKPIMPVEVLDDARLFWDAAAADFSEHGLAFGPAVDFLDIPVLQRQWEFRKMCSASFSRIELHS